VLARGQAIDVEEVVVVGALRDPGIGLGRLPAVHVDVGAAAFLRRDAHHRYSGALE
jgi:hypothetical protein